MGNKQSCCIAAAPKGSSRKGKTVEEKYIVDDPEPSPVRATSSSNLQHISEREPEGKQSENDQTWLRSGRGDSLSCRTGVTECKVTPRSGHDHMPISTVFKNGHDKHL